MCPNNWTHLHNIFITHHPALAGVHKFPHLTKMTNISITPRLARNCFHIKRMYLTTIRTGILSFGSVLGVPVVSNLHRASAASCFTPVQWIISESYSYNLSRDQASLTVTKAIFRFFRSAWWSIMRGNPYPSKYGRRNNTTRTRARRSQRVVSRLFLLSIRARDQYPMGFVVTSS